MTAFGANECLVLHCNEVNNESINNETPSFSASHERPTGLAHYAAGACAGLVQSNVLGRVHLPHNLRTQLSLRRALYHSVGYAFLFGT